MCEMLVKKGGYLAECFLRLRYTVVELVLRVRLALKYLQLRLYACPAQLGGERAPCC